MPDSEIRNVKLFIPALALILARAEQLKQGPLTAEEVEKICREAPHIMMTAADAAAMAETRGPDIDPENCWQDWQRFRQARTT
jgi:hypothetical protein